MIRRTRKLHACQSDQTEPGLAYAKGWPEIALCTALVRSRAVKSMAALVAAKNSIVQRMARKK